MSSHATGAGYYVKPCNLRMVPRRGNFSRCLPLAASSHAVDSLRAAVSLRQYGSGSRISRKHYVNYFRVILTLRCAFRPEGCCTLQTHDRQLSDTTGKYLLQLHQVGSSVSIV